MRSVKIIGALATAVCALFVAAVPALAHEFTASQYNKTISPGTPVGLKGGSEEEQEFRLAQFKFTCEKTVVKGKVYNASSETLYNTVKFTACTTYLTPEHSREKLPFKVKFKQPFDFEYHANGYVGSGGESESEVDLVNPASRRSCGRRHQMRPLLAAAGHSSQGRKKTRRRILRCDVLE